jgi:hypothetical protein
MTQFTELLNAALTDPFRIVLLAGLVITQRRTAAQTGTVLPLAAGVLFVAVILHLTMGFGTQAGSVMAIGVGMVANVIWLVPMILIARFWTKYQG